jgi:hypothetical protein
MRTKNPNVARRSCAIYQQIVGPEFFPKSFQDVTTTRSRGKVCLVASPHASAISISWEGRMTPGIGQPASAIPQQLPAYILPACVRHCKLGLSVSRRPQVAGTTVWHCHSLIIRSTRLRPSF